MWPPLPPPYVSYLCNLHLHLHVVTTQSVELSPWVRYTDKYSTVRTQAISNNDRSREPNPNAILSKRLDTSAKCVANIQIAPYIRSHWPKSGQLGSQSGAEERMVSKKQNPPPKKSKIKKSNAPFEKMAFRKSRAVPVIPQNSPRFFTPDRQENKTKKHQQGDKINAHAQDLCELQKIIKKATGREDQGARGY